jgi:hypothetical protein
MENVAELEFAASSLTIITTRVDGDIDNPAFICSVNTPSGDLWPICRRLSMFATLRAELCADANPAVNALPFPKEKSKIQVPTLWGLLSSKPEETVTQRKRILEEWANEVLTLCPGDKRLLTFMADDGSISTAQARDFGIEVVSSAPSRRLDADSAPANAADLQQHRARQSRKNKVVLAELDTQPERAELSLSCLSGPAPAPSASATEPAPETAVVARLGDSALAAVKQASTSGLAQLGTLGSQLKDKLQGQERVAYHVKCFTKGGDSWVVRKSFSDFLALAATLTKDGNPAITSLAFPHPSRYYSFTMSLVGDDEKEVLERMLALEQWLNDAIELCTGLPEMRSFLSREHSVPEAAAVRETVAGAAAAASGGGAVEAELQEAEKAGQAVEAVEAGQAEEAVVEAEEAGQVEEAEEVGQVEEQEQERSNEVEDEDDDDGAGGGGGGDDNNDSDDSEGEVGESEESAGSGRDEDSAVAAAADPGAYQPTRASASAAAVDDDDLLE